jgi:transcriptional regulator with XRE-family HTH domain
MFDEYGEIEPIGKEVWHDEGRELMITAAQCRSARTLLTWSVSKLASAASVSDSDIDDFELERRLPAAATLDAIQRAFEEVGVKFLGNDDVRLGVDASPSK